VNRAESVKARLKNIAVAEKKPFNYILMHYFMERFLYRLSVSAYSGNFILKGGLLLYAVLDNKARTTRDIFRLCSQIQFLQSKYFFHYISVLSYPVTII
jgi:hypothetical protein